MNLDTQVAVLCLTCLKDFQRSGSYIADKISSSTGLEFIGCSHLVLMYRYKELENPGAEQCSLNG